MSAKVWEILKTIGSEVIEEVVPGGAGIIELINFALPEGSKLPSSATGEQATGAVMTLPAEQQAEVLNRRIDLDIATIKAKGESLSAMLTADATSSHTTRPWIAKWSFVFVAVFSGAVGAVVVWAWAYAVYEQNADLVGAIVDGWPFVLSLLGAVTGTFSLLLRAYFGILQQEHETKLTAATGNFKPSSIASIINAFKK